MDKNPSNTGEVGEPIISGAPSTPITTEAPATPESTEKKGSKKKLIIGIACAVAGIGITAGGAVAIANVVMNQDNAVTRAISKLARSDGPNFFHIDGTVSGDVNTSAGNQLNVNLDIDTTFGKEFSDGGDMSLALTVKDGSMVAPTIGLDFKAVPSGDLYAKLTGVSTILRVSSAITTANSTANPTAGIAKAANSILMAASTYDGEWISFPRSTVKQFTDEETTASIVSDSSQCIISVIKKLPSYGDDIVSHYRKNPFITPSTDNLEIEKKANTLYRLGLDSDKLVNFTNGLVDSKIGKDILACTGGQDAAEKKLTKEQVESSFGEGVPAFYVEIDDNDNITRFYVDGKNRDDNNSWTADFNISYLDGIDITKPATSTDIMTVVQNVMMRLQGGYSSTSLTF